MVHMVQGHMVLDHKSRLKLFNFIDHYIRRCSIAVFSLVHDFNNFFWLMKSYLVIDTNNFLIFTKALPILIVSVSAVVRVDHYGRNQT